MVNYRDSKVYTIAPVGVTDFPPYVGVTVKQYLPMRFSQHKQQYKQWLNGQGANNPLYDIFCLFGPENCQIKLLEKYPCDTIYELTARQQHWISKKKAINDMNIGDALFSYLKEPEEEENPSGLNQSGFTHGEIIPHEASLPIGTNPVLIPLIPIN